MTTYATSTDGVRIAYESHGAGRRAIVLVHGWSTDRSYWSEQLLPLAARLRVVTLDLAGHGDSGTEREKWTMPAFGADVASVVRDLALDNVILVGHSMAGTVILEAARLLEGQVRGLVMIDRYRQLSQIPSQEKVRERVAPFRTDFIGATRAFVRSMFPKSADESLVERITADVSSAPTRIAIPCLEAVWGNTENDLASLAYLNLPVVAINPEHPPTDTESLNRHRIQVVLLPEVGHLMMLEAPTAFNDCLLKVVHGFPQ